MMEAVCGGKLDRDIIRAVFKSEKGSSRNSATAYFKNSKLDYPNSETPKASKKYVKAMKKLHETIPPHTPFNRQFLDLLKKIFVYDPKKRITAKQALQHPWFKEALMDDGTEARKIRMEREKKRQRQAESRYQWRQNDITTMSSNHLHTRHKTRGLQAAYSHPLHLRVDTKHGNLAGGVSSDFLASKW